MKNKIYNILAATILIFAFNGAAFAQKIAIIDIEQISKEAKVVKYIAKKISKKRDKFQKEITAKEDSLQKEKEKIEAKKTVLSQEKLEEKQKEFFKKVEELKKFASKRDKTLKGAYSVAIKKVNDKVGEIVSQVAKEKGLSLVLPTSQVVFSVDKLDITKEVIEKLDKKISKISVKFD